MCPTAGPKRPCGPSRRNSSISMSFASPPTWRSRNCSGTRYPAIERRVAMITQSLNNIFEREHTLSLDRLKTISKRDARQFLRELPDIHPFVEAYVMLFAFEGHAFPVDEGFLACFREHGVVEEGDAAGRSPAFRRAPSQGRRVLRFLRRPAPLPGRRRAAKTKKKK